MTPLCLSIIRSVCDLVCLQPVGSDRPGNMQSAWFCLFTASKEEEEKKITLLFFFSPGCICCCAALHYAFYFLTSVFSVVIVFLS